MIKLTNIPNQDRTTLDEFDINVKDCYRFWDRSKLDIYNSLSWLNKDLNINNLNLNTWFKTKKIETDHVTLNKFKVQDALEEEEVTYIVKARKLKLNPTAEQKTKLSKWAGCTRYLYNKTIAHLTDPNFNKKNIYNVKDRLAVIKDNNFYFNKPWLKECPSAIRKNAIFQAHSNLQANFTNLRNGNIKKFNNPFRTKKREKQNGWSLGLERLNISKDCDKLYIFKTILGEMKYFNTKQLHKLMPYIHPEMDCKVQKDEFGDYYLVIPYKVYVKDKPTKFLNPVSIDPGVRKFITTYAPNNQESYIFGDRWATDVMSKLVTLDSMYSDYNNMSKSKEKRILKDKIRKLRKRIHYYKIEMRNKVANIITKEYDLILMPKLDIKSLSAKTTRRLKTKTVRMLLNARHAEFFKHLKNKALEQGVKFLQVREEYTSQTCPCCGCLNKCDELYKCRNCEFCQDRDVVGALNILLKATR